MNSFKTLGLMLLLAWPLAACADKEEMTGGPVVVFNHTGKWVSAAVKGGPGGDAPPYDGGAAFMCCVDFPLEWRPDLKATIIWSTESDLPNQEWTPDREVTVSIPKYIQAANNFQIHVLPKGEVKVFISPYSTGNEAHPLYELGNKTHENWVLYEKIQQLKEEDKQEKESKDESH